MSAHDWGFLLGIIGLAVAYAVHLVRREDVQRGWHAFGEEVDNVLETYHTRKRYVSVDVAKPGSDVTMVDCHDPACPLCPYEVKSEEHLHKKEPMAVRNYFPPHPLVVMTSKGAFTVPDSNVKNKRALAWEQMRTFVREGQPLVLREGIAALQDLGARREYIERVTDDLVKFGKPRFE